MPTVNGSGETCASAKAITLAFVDGGSFAQETGTTVGHVDDDPNTLSCGMSTDAGLDVAYSLVMAEGDLLDVTLTPSAASSLHPVLKLRAPDDDCGGASQPRCNYRQEVTSVGFTTRIASTGTHHLIVDGTDGTQGCFTLDVKVFPPAKIGSCAMPLDVTLRRSLPPVRPATPCPAPRYSLLALVYGVIRTEGLRLDGSSSSPPQTGVAKRSATNELTRHEAWRGTLEAGTPPS